MVLLQRLKAWGAVEKNGRRLHLINISIGYGTSEQRNFCPCICRANGVWSTGA